MDNEHRSARRGILGQFSRLDGWLHLIFLVLVATSALRYHARHDLLADGWLILAGALALVIGYLLRPVAAAHHLTVVWSLSVVLLWAALTLKAPSFAWCAVPIAFAVLQVLRFRVAAGIVVAMMLTVSVGWLRVSNDVDPTLVAGPVGIGLLTLIAYRALEREAAARQRLVDDLLRAQERLAEAERRAGALAERARLSRDIHDSIGQDLSSINLFLQAAEQSWGEPQSRERVHTAARTARGALDAVRRVVHDLADERLAGAAAPEITRRLQQIAEQPCGGTRVQLRVDGASRPLPAPLAEAVIFTVRGALANVRDHARAERAMVTLTYDDDRLRLDVRDDGCGFQLATLRAPRSGSLRGHGLAGLRQRVSAMGGTLELDSSPGEGTTLSAVFPLEAS
ncbi:sensor histidine kinase [Glutamicibacter endophyticus]